MKQILPLCFIALQLLTACHSQPAQPSLNTDASVKADQQQGFAVIELFTSQGCSSCPPADALLGKEIAAYKKAGKKLIALSFHVDYWNRLGWTDPYSQHSFTERQYGYSGRMKLSSVYTPQAVINGKWETVGGKQGTIENFIAQSFVEKTVSSIIINSVKPTGKGSIEVNYNYSGPATALNIAVVQNQISTPVKAGENDGRILINYNVVRSWKTIDTQSGSHTVSIEQPAGYSDREYSVVVYAQEKGYGKIAAADIK